MTHIKNTLIFPVSLLFGLSFFLGCDENKRDRSSSRHSQSQTADAANNKSDITSSKNIQLASSMLSKSCVDVNAYPGNGLAEKINEAVKDQKVLPAELCVSKPGPISNPVYIPGGISLILAAGIYPQTAAIILQPKRAIDVSDPAQTNMGPAIIGSHAGATILIAETNVAAPNIGIATSTNHYKISGLTLTREERGTLQSQVGILTELSNNNGLIENITIENQFDGMRLGVTGFSLIQHVKVFNSTRNGIYMTNDQSPNGGPCQYHLQHILIQESGTNGILVLPATSSISLANWDNVNTFGNGQHGIALLSQGAFATEGARINATFVGTDGQVLAGSSGLHIAGGTNHQISNSFFELAGRAYEGRKTPSPAATAGTSSAPGILLSNGTGSVQLNNVIINGNSGNGITSSASQLSITGSTISNNGLSEISGSRGGILSLKGKLRITASTFSNAAGHQLVAVQSAGQATIIGSSASGYPSSWAVPAGSVLIGNSQ